MGSSSRRNVDGCLSPVPGRQSTAVRARSDGFFGPARSREGVGTSRRLEPVMPSRDAGADMAEMATAAMPRRRTWLWVAGLVVLALIGYRLLVRSADTASVAAVSGGAGGKPAAPPIPVVAAAA